jgi:hypothetical protein
VFFSTFIFYLNGDELQMSLYIADDPSEEILSKAIAHYGEPAQVLKCIEELAELAEALVFTLNGDNRENIQYENIAFDMAVTKTACKTATIKNTDVVYDGELIDNIVSELADVFITATQTLKIFSTPEEFQKVRDIKLNRLKERIADNELKTWLADKDDSAIAVEEPQRGLLG